MKTCEDWIKEHRHCEEYLDFLILNERIAPAQADWLIKKIIIDESGKKYITDEDKDTCGFEIWCDIKDIEGYFINK